MAFRKFSERPHGGFQRQIHDVSDMNIKCMDCGVDINQLPFQPDPARLDSLRCKDCMRKYRESKPRRF